MVLTFISHTSFPHVITKELGRKKVANLARIKNVFRIEHFFDAPARRTLVTSVVS